MGLATHAAITLPTGLRYAHPAMMALANLLAHPEVGSATMSDTGYLRSAKDLGRVLALARLTDPDALDEWPALWRAALAVHFPRSAAELVARCGSGLAALVADPSALEQARKILGTSLLAARPPSLDALRALARQLQRQVLAKLRSPR